MKQAQPAPSPQATSSGYGSGGSTPAGTPTSHRKSFGVLPQPSLSPIGPPATTQAMPRCTQAPVATSATTGPSQCPGLFSTIPSLKLGAPQSTVPSGAGRGLPSAAAAGLTVAVPGAGTSLGGRSFFATNPYSARPAGRLQTAGAPTKDDDEAVDAELSHLAQDVSWKRQHEGDNGDGDGEGTEETDGSDIEDMTAPSVRKGKSRQSPAKSMKRESSTEAYTEANIAIARADRYAKDFPALQNYRNNEALPTETNCFNLASHEAYLDSITGTRGVTS